MRLLFFSTWATVLLDVLAWFVFHMGISWLVTRLPDRWFNGEPSRPRNSRFEFRLYEKLFLIKHWKHYLPDAAPWFGGFPKKSLRERNADYLLRFKAETRRGELAHWLTFAMAPLFFLWNPPMVGWWMIVYAALANIPCILVQRYNRR